MAIPDLEDDLVRKWERWYASRPDYVARMTERGGRYLFHIVEEVHRRQMPMELALLPFIESAFNPQAISSARASGMWQFMPATGRSFELKQNIFRDDRRDVLESTRAALDYLQLLHRMFDDWHLALAAYNWGQGNVQRAIARNQRAGLPSGYRDLRMPDETRNYVPKLQAVKNIVRDPAFFSLTLAPLENHPFFLAVAIERDIDVSRVIAMSGVSAEEFEVLNPQLNKPVILAAGTPRVLLPYDAANRFVRALAAHEGALASWTAWVVPRTLRPAAAAAQVGMTEAALRQANRIPAGMLIKAGSTLLVHRNARSHRDVEDTVADSAQIQFARETPSTRSRTVKVGNRAESLASIARRHGVSEEQVARWNGVSRQTVFKPGATVVVRGGSPPKSKASTSKPSSSKTSTSKTTTVKASPVKRAATGTRPSGVKASAGRTAPDNTPRRPSTRASAPSPGR
jgi:membrane-bound lytic murein transglycosylase D